MSEEAEGNCAEEETKKKYILFVCQESNFQSRTMIVPYEEFVSVEKRKHQLETLIQNAKEEGVIFIEQIEEKITETDKKLERIKNDLTFYANMGSYEWGQTYIDLEDAVWFDRNDCLTCLCGGFNHTKNFVDLCCQTEFTDREGNLLIVSFKHEFLLLESYDGKVERCRYETPDEMMIDIYGYDSKGNIYDMEKAKAFLEKVENCGYKENESFK